MATIHVLVCDLFSVLESWVLVLLDLAFHVLFSPHSLLFRHTQGMLAAERHHTDRAIVMPTMDDIETSCPFLRIFMFTFRAWCSSKVRYFQRVKTETDQVLRNFHTLQMKNEEVCYGFR
jgi:hypothetical protein